MRVLTPASSTGSTYAVASLSPAVRGRVNLSVASIRTFARSEHSQSPLAGIRSSLRRAGGASDETLRSGKEIRLFTVNNSSSKRSVDVKAQAGGGNTGSGGSKGGGGGGGGGGGSGGSGGDASNSGVPPSGLQLLAL
ncbi:unnamed protein product, partial [Closterium sp. NIES-53]